MIKQKMKKFISFWILILFFLNSLNFSLLELFPKANASYNSSSTYSISSSGGTFTGSSNLNSLSGSLINTGSLNFDFSFSLYVYTGASFKISYDNGLDSGYLLANTKDYTSSSQLSGDGQKFFSGSFLNQYQNNSSFLSGTSVNILNMQDGKYSVTVTASGYSNKKNDSINYDFTVDKTSPEFTNTGYILSNNDYVELDNIKINDTNFSGAILSYYPIGLSNIYTQNISGFTDSNGIFNSDMLLTGLTPGTHYQYNIKAFDKAGNSSIIYGYFNTLGTPPNGGQSTTNPGTVANSQAQILSFSGSKFLNSSFSGIYNIQVYGSGFTTADKISGKIFDENNNVFGSGFLIGGGVNNIFNLGIDLKDKLKSYTGSVLNVELSVNDSGATGTGFIINIDNEKPNSVLNIISGNKINDWYGSGVTFSLSGSDNLSGVNFIKYCISSNSSCIPNSIYSGTVNIDSEGINYVFFNAIDNVGNSENIKSFPIKIDKSAPIINSIGNPSNISNSGAIIDGIGIKDYSFSGAKLIVSGSGFSGNFPINFGSPITDNNGMNSFSGYSQIVGLPISQSQSVFYYHIGVIDLFGNVTNSQTGTFTLPAIPSSGSGGGGSGGTGSTNNVPKGNTFTVNVVNYDGAPVSKAHVYVKSPSGNINPFLADTNGSGQVTFTNIPLGGYVFGVNIDGFQTPPEQSINIGTYSSFIGNINVNIPNLSISGLVLKNNTDPLGDVNIYAFETNKKIYLTTKTDSNGNYKLLVQAGSWKIGGNTLSFGPLSEILLNVSSSIVENFNINYSDYSTFSGNVSLLGSGGISGVNIIAEPVNGTGSNGGSTSTDSAGNYSILLKQGIYNIKAYSSSYGNVGILNNVQINGNKGSNNFIVNPPKNLAVSFTGSGLPQDLSNFEWIIDVADTTNNKGFNQTIKGVSSFIFPNVLPGIYSIKVRATGIGQVYSSGSYSFSNDSNINISLGSLEKLVSVSGFVSESSTDNRLSDSYVEFRDTDSKTVFGTKTNSGGYYEIKLKSGTNFELVAKKPGYNQSIYYSGSIGNTAYNHDISLEKILNTINISGTLIGSGDLDGKTAFINLKGVNTDGSENNKWYGKELTLSSGQFLLDGVPGNFGSGILSVATEGYEVRKDIIRNYGSDINVGQFSLNPLSVVFIPKSSIISPALGGIIDDLNFSFRIVLPRFALGDSTDLGTITTKQTNIVPSISGSDPIGGKAKEISATDGSGNTISTLATDATIEMTYLGSEIYSTNSGVTVDEIKNLQIVYYDATSMSWVPLPTVVSSSNSSIFDNYSGSTLSQVSGYENISFTLKATTNHFTLFTALISTAIRNSAPISTNNIQNVNGNIGGGNTGGGGGGGSSSIISGFAKTVTGISSYFGKIEQAIVLKTGKSLDSVLTINRNGGNVLLSNILTESNKTLSNVSKNLVSFAVGDIISTSKEGSVQIALDGYTKLDLNPGSSVKISDVGADYLTYDNLSGKTKYDFTSRNSGSFKYQIKGKTGYATIRGTTLEVASDNLSDTYNLIHGKISVFNAKLNKTVEMLSGDSYTVYADGTEKFSKSLSSQADFISVKDPCFFTDISVKDFICSILLKFKDKGVISSNNKSFNPLRNISRAELLGIIMKIANKQTSYKDTSTYFDISKNDWWAPSVSSAKSLGFISQTNQNFYPQRDITRAEALQIILKAKNIDLNFNYNYTFDDISSLNWWAKAVSTAKKAGYISSANKKFRPSDPISRQEAIIMINSVFK